MHEGGESSRHQVVQHLPNGNGTVASVLLLAVEDRGAAEVRNDRRWNLACYLKIDDLR